MKRYLHIALMLLCVLVVPACGDDDEVDQEAVELEAYKLEQELAFLEKADDPNYVKWESEAGDGYVLAKLIKRERVKEPILIVVFRFIIKVILRMGICLTSTRRKTVSLSDVQ